MNHAPGRPNRLVAIATGLGIVLGGTACSLGQGDELGPSLAAAKSKGQLCSNDISEQNPLANRTGKDEAARLLAKDACVQIIVVDAKGGVSNTATTSNELYIQKEMLSSMLADTNDTKEQVQTTFQDATYGRYSPRDVSITHVTEPFMLNKCFTVPNNDNPSSRQDTIRLKKAIMPFEDEDKSNIVLLNGDACQGDTDLKTKGFAIEASISVLFKSALSENFYSTMVHEEGHKFGLFHAGQAKNCSNPPLAKYCDIEAKADNSSPMSYENVLDDAKLTDAELTDATLPFTIAELHMLGLLPQEQFKIIPSEGEIELGRGPKNSTLQLLVDTNEKGVPVYITVEQQNGVACDTPKNVSKYAPVIKEINAVGDNYEPYVCYTTPDEDRVFVRFVAQDDQESSSTKDSYTQKSLALIDAYPTIRSVNGNGNVHIGQVDGYKAGDVIFESAIKTVKVKSIKNGVATISVKGR